MALPGGAAMNITIRLQFEKDRVSFSDIAAAIGKAGGDIVGIDVISSSKVHTVRDITVSALDTKQCDLIIEALKRIQGVKIVNVSDRTFLMHIGGKLKPARKFR